MAKNLLATVRFSLRIEKSDASFLRLIASQRKLPLADFLRNIVSLSILTLPFDWPRVRKNVVSKGKFKNPILIRIEMKKAATCYLEGICFKN